MIRLEKATPEDRGAINMLAMEVHSLHVDWRPDIYEMPREIYPVERFSAALERNELYVARLNGCIVGYAAIKMRNFDWAGMVKRRVLFVDELSVSAEHRRKGIGRAMMMEIRNMAQEEGCSDLQLSVYPQNREAVAFYEACGFSIQSMTMSTKI